MYSAMLTSPFIAFIYLAACIHVRGTLMAFYQSRLASITKVQKNMSEGKWAKDLEKCRGTWISDSRMFHGRMQQVINSCHARVSYQNIYAEVRTINTRERSAFTRWRAFDHVLCQRLLWMHRPAIQRVIIHDLGLLSSRLRWNVKGAFKAKQATNEPESWLSRASRYF